MSKWVKFFRQYREFKEQGDGSFPLGKWYPRLDDIGKECGEVRGTYPIGDLYVAQKIFEAKPVNHLDIGSRIDGFVFHVASFREISVMDIRNMPFKIKNINFINHDITDDIISSGEWHSISCLHSLEHYGMGRYGDKVNFSGYLEALNNIFFMLKWGGTFYLAIPVGKQRIDWNAYRVFDFGRITQTLKDIGFKIQSLVFINNDGILLDRIVSGSESYAIFELLK